MNLSLYPSDLQGVLRLPPSKSITHRALIAAALCQKESLIHPVDESQDILATLDCLKTMGASVSKQGSGLCIKGIDPAAIPACTLDCRESGSTLRFLIPVAALSQSVITFTGKDTLLSRPMGVYANLFASQGLRFDQSAEAIIIQGPLSPGLFTLEGNVSSQFISGLLFALPCMDQSSELAVLPPFQSRPYVDITRQVLKDFGIQIEMPSENGFAVSPQTYQPASFQVEADYSQLAFFAVYAALKNTLCFENLNPDSLQGDRIILEILQKSGAKAFFDQDLLIVEPLATQPLSVSLEGCPDLAPALFVLASFLDGTSTFSESARLAYKESNRIESMECELKKFGVDFSFDGSNVLITGKKQYPKDKVVIDSHHDHRVVMAMSIFALINGSPVEIENAQDVNKSYPSFFRDLEKLGAKIL